MKFFKGLLIALPFALIIWAIAIALYFILITG